MPVFEQGYRPYVGPRTSRPRAFAIAAENIRPRLRWWVWLLMFFLLFIPLAFYSAGTIVTALGGNWGGAQAAAGQHRTVAFTAGGAGAAFLETLKGQSLAIYWHFLNGISWQTVMIPAVACSGLFAADRRTGALQIYFARPVSRLDYLTGKLLAGAFFVALSTAVPSLLLWILNVALGTTAGIGWSTWIAPFSIVAASAFYALWTLGLVLFFSSIMRRPAFVALTAVFVHMILEGMGLILSESFNDPSWTVIQPSRAVGTVTTALFDVDLPPWMNVPTAAAIGVGVPLVLLAIAWSRVRAVEVST